MKLLLVISCLFTIASADFGLLMKLLLGKAGKHGHVAPVSNANSVESVRAQSVPSSNSYSGVRHHPISSPHNGGNSHYNGNSHHNVHPHSVGSPHSGARLNFGGYTQPNLHVNVPIHSSVPQSGSVPYTNGIPHLNTGGNSYSVGHLNLRDNVHIGVNPHSSATYTDTSSNSGGSALETGNSGRLDYSSGSGAATRIVKPVIRHGEPIISKTYFIHEAPIEEARGIEVEEKEHVVNPRKHYNIVFIKAPVDSGSSVNNNNVNVFPENEEKTIIYVLSGKNEGVNVNENGEIEVPEPKPPSKPEVVFVKYNNEEDAQRAISDIQSHYDNQQGASVSVIGAGGSGGSSSESIGIRSGAEAHTHSSGSSTSSHSLHTESNPVRSVRFGRQAIKIPAATATAIQIQKSKVARAT